MNCIAAVLLLSDIQQFMISSVDHESILQRKWVEAHGMTCGPLFTLSSMTCGPLFTLLPGNDHKGLLIVRDERKSIILCVQILWVMFWSFKGYFYLGNRLQNSDMMSLFGRQVA
jgi:hypothetical protein